MGPGSSNFTELLERFFAGDQRALSRVITVMENEYTGYDKIAASIHRKSGQAHIIGLTGPPGVGKSTLVDRLVRQFRQWGKAVGVLAVDPSSPFTGGAVLGDRVRMQEIILDPNVFIRSMATRGHLGGLAKASFNVIKALDAFGFDVVLVETVGAGQSEVDIMQMAHSTVVVLAPGLGDEIQAIKAGILEIGNVLVVNKADLEGTDKAVAELEMMVSMGSGRQWKPPVLKTVARQNEGIAELAEAITEHFNTFVVKGWLEKFKQQKAVQELKLVLTNSLINYLFMGSQGQKIDDYIKAIAGRKTDPYTAVGEILSDILPSGTTENA